MRCGRPPASADCTGPGHQRHCRARFGAGARQREAHLAGTRVGEAAHRIERLEGRPGRQQHPLAGQRLRLQEGDQRVEQFLRFQHAALADFAAGLLASSRTENGDAVGCQLRDVALRRRLFPHLPVHRRRHQQRAVARQAQRGQQIVGHAVGESREEIGRGRRHQHGIGAAGQIDVRHGRDSRPTHRLVHTGRPDSAWKVTAPTKCVAASVMHHIDLCARLDQQARRVPPPCRRRCRR